MLPDGRFRWTDPAPGSIRPSNPIFTVRAKGFLRHLAFLSAKQVETLRAGKAIRPIEIVLYPPATVTGRVIAADGGPGDGVTVALTRRPQDRYPKHSRTTTDADGTFRFNSVDPSRPLHLVAWRTEKAGEVRSGAQRVALEPAHRAAAWRELHLRKAEPVELTVALPPLAAGTKVFVTGRQLNPAPDAGVLKTIVRTGPNRITLKDVACRTISEHDVQVPDGYRTFDVVISEAR